MRIRLARVDDLARIQDIEQAAGRLFDGTGLLDVHGHDPYPFETLRAAVLDARLWVAVGADDVPVGFALARMLGDEPHLQELDVHPDYGRRGIGRALVETVCTWARAGGFPSLTLTTFTGIPWNAPYYARLGFAVVPPEAYTPAQQAELESEVAAGLPRDRRVVMRRVFADGAGAGRGDPA